jgi:hypothetical protein
MGVDIRVGRVFLVHVFVQLNLNKVLQDIGMVTRVEGVAVAEHRDSNLVDAVPTVRSLMRANRHYPSDTPSGVRPQL